MQPGLGNNAQQQDDPNNSNQFPVSLKNFIGRSLDEVTPEDKPLLEAQLKQIITKAYELNAAWTTNWDNITAPILEARRLEIKSKHQANNEILTPKEKPLPRNNKQNKQNKKDTQNAKGKNNK